MCNQIIFWWYISETQSNFVENNIIEPHVAEYIVSYDNVIVQSSSTTKCLIPALSDILTLIANTQNYLNFNIVSSFNP